MSPRVAQRVPHRKAHRTVFQVALKPALQTARQTANLLARVWVLMGVLAVIGNAARAQAQETDYALRVDVQQKGSTFATAVSFRLPLRMCQAWRFLVDYESAKRIPGVIESKFTRLSDNKVRVERVMQDSILFFPIRMRSVMEYTELPPQGTDFVQIEGQTKSHQGSWRLQADGDATVFRYTAVSEPDSALPMPVIRYFISNRLRSSFAAMAQYGATRQDQPCD